MNNSIVININFNNNVSQPVKSINLEFYETGEIVNNVVSVSDNTHNIQDTRSLSDHNTSNNSYDRYNRIGETSIIDNDISIKQKEVVLPDIPTTDGREIRPTDEMNETF